MVTPNCVHYRRNWPTPGARDDGHAIGHLHDELNGIEAWSAEARAEQLLVGLGFAVEALRNPVSSFSGGWRMRLNLAQALMYRSDLLLLDEADQPPGSGNRALAGRLAAHLSGHVAADLARPGFLGLCAATSSKSPTSASPPTAVITAPMNTPAANGWHLSRRRFRQQRQIAHMQSFIDRFKAKASKAKQAQSRVKALERLERIAPAHADTPFDFQFAAPSSLPNPLLRLESVNAGYGRHVVLHNLELSIEAGARIGLLGVNGAGKSTLVKLMCGDLSPLKGLRHGAQNLNIGYFAQHQLDTLRAARWRMRHIAPQEQEQTLRGFHRAFNFHGDDATSPVGPMSGGEKARLALALVVWHRPNLLLLDEPTNHLDLEMRHALTLALQD